MKTTLIDMLTSKKFLAMIAAAIVFGVGRIGFDVDPAALDRFLALVAVYITGQSIADIGKGAALVHAAGGPRSSGIALDSVAERVPRASDAPTLEESIRAGVVHIAGGPRPQPVFSPSTMPRGPEAGRIGLTVATLLATIGLFCWACASVGPAVSTGTVAALDCEAPDIARVFADLLPIAESAVERWIGAGGKVDTAGLKADMAKIKSDLGRCLEAGAIAALGNRRSVAGPTVDGTQALAAFATARASLGWAPVRLPGGQTL